MAAAVERNLTNLEGLTEPLGQKGDAMAEAVLGNLEGLSRVIEELTVLSEALNNREGSLGKIVHSPELYDNANRVLVNANHLILRLNDLSCRLRPAVEDARVFLDKVAREPGRIVGGALNTGPGIK
jgi:phospholipid/cholesterol/gamma-HCH transport system substrate-binding protein